MSYYLGWSKSVININNIREALPGISVKVKIKYTCRTAVGLRIALVVI